MDQRDTLGSLPPPNQAKNEIFCFHEIMQTAVSATKPPPLHMFGFAQFGNHCLEHVLEYKLPPLSSVGTTLAFNLVSHQNGH